MPVNGHWLVWDKIGNYNFENPYSDCELIWTNINQKKVKKYICIQQGYINECKNEERVHPTQKPLKLIKQIIEDYTKENDIVLDCFLGSGTTAKAAKQLGRHFLGFELNENYYKIAKDRLNGITQEDRKKEKIGQIKLF